MSWFTSGLDMLNELKDQVAEAIPDVNIPVDKEMLAKLTLNTDEMKAERQQFGEDETRRRKVKNMLAGMFPWETRDSERDILVEECREAILALSQNESTFFGPYEMPRLNVELEEEEEDKNDNHSDDEEGSETGSQKEEEEEDNDAPAKKTTAHHHHLDRRPSPESKEKLEKLSPLPPLLEQFDLDAHVGLIEKLLKEDPHLVKAQSKLSGGGAREFVFWRNYFFHCAYTRYEAGLSIDEIWSFSEESIMIDQDPLEKSGGEHAEEETVVFDDTSAPAAAGASESSSSSPPEHAFPEDPRVGDEDEDEDDTQQSGDAERNTTVPTSSSPNDSVLSSNGDFEVLDSDYNYASAGSGDPELDELEAEIQRELEDL